MRILKVLALCVALPIVTSSPVYAYTDPGSGTMLLQMLLAILVGLMFYIRRITAWARGLLRSRSGGSSEQGQESEHKQQTSDFAEN